MSWKSDESFDTFGHFPHANFDSDIAIAGRGSVAPASGVHISDIVC
jgi:hypothetical protein